MSVDAVDRFRIPVGEAAAEIGRARMECWSKCQVEGEHNWKVKRSLIAVFHILKSRFITVIFGKCQSDQGKKIFVLYPAPP
jgi:hypothetical protein